MLEKDNDGTLAGAEGRAHAGVPVARARSIMPPARAMTAT